jgi:hypothetical protein
VVTKKLTVPIPEDAKILTCEKTWLLGVLVGDTHLDIKNGRLILESGFKNPDKDFLEIWKQNVERIYNITCRPWKRKGKLVGYVLTSRASVNDLLRYGRFGRYKWLFQMK